MASCFAGAGFGGGWLMAGVETAEIVVSVQGVEVSRLTVELRNDEPLLEQLADAFVRSGGEVRRRARGY